jgi:uncharacterized cupredoxin-like copper-binding protein
VLGIVAGRAVLVVVQTTWQIVHEMEVEVEEASTVQQKRWSSCEQQPEEQEHVASHEKKINTWSKFLNTWSKFLNSMLIS